MASVLPRLTSGSRHTPSPQSTNNRELDGTVHQIEQVISIVNANTAITLTEGVPANAEIIFAEMNWDTAIGLATAVKVGLGISGDPDSILLSAATLTKNTHTSGLPLTTKYVTAATPIIVACVDTNGAAAGTFNATASAYVRVVYRHRRIVADAA